MKMAQMLVLDDSFELLLVSLKKAIDDEDFESALSIDNEFKLKLVEVFGNEAVSVVEADEYKELLIKHQMLINAVESSRLLLRKDMAKFNKNKTNLKKYEDASK